MKVRGARGWGCQKEARAETYLHNMEGIPTKGTKTASPTVASRATLPSSSESIGLPGGQWFNTPKTSLPPTPWRRSSSNRRLLQAASQEQQQKWAAAGEPVVPQGPAAMGCSPRQQQPLQAAAPGSIRASGCSAGRRYRSAGQS